LARFSLLVNITAKGLKLAICKAATGFGQLRSLIAFFIFLFFGRHCIWCSATLTKGFGDFAAKLPNFSDPMFYFTKLKTH